MSARTPDGISKYVSKHRLGDQVYAYLGLDKQNQVQKFGGELTFFGIDHIDSTFDIVKQIPWLEGLLPVGRNPLKIENARLFNQHYFDLHCFTNNGKQWVVFFDVAVEAIEAHKQQQSRLQDDIQVERSLEQQK